MKKIASLVLASILGGGLALGGYFIISDQLPETDDTLRTDEHRPQIFQTNYVPTSKSRLEQTP